MSKITKSTYQRLPERAWIGTTVVLLADLITVGAVEFKKGEILTIIGKHRGFELRSSDGRKIKHVSHLLVETINK